MFIIVKRSCVFSEDKHLQIPLRAGAKPIDVSEACARWAVSQGFAERVVEPPANKVVEPPATKAGEPKVGKAR